MVSPAALGGDAAAALFLDRARERGGAVVSLHAVLGRLGIPPRSGAESLLEALGVSRREFERGADLARDLLQALAEALDRFDDSGLGEDPGRERARPARADLVEAVRQLPEGPGVYTFLSEAGRALYVGKARSLRRRVAGHLIEGGREPAMRATLIREATSVRWRATGSELEALLLEQETIRADDPSLNTQRAAHRRRRGPWRGRSVALVLPSTAPEANALCLVSGEGRLHWETVPRRPSLSREVWRRVAGFREGTFPGWSPLRPGEELEPDRARALAEVALTWLVAHEDQVTRVALGDEPGLRSLRDRLRRALAQDARGGRIEVR